MMLTIFNPSLVENVGYSHQKHPWPQWHLGRRIWKINQTHSCCSRVASPFHKNKTPRSFGRHWCMGCSFRAGVQFVRSLLVIMSLRLWSRELGCPFSQMKAVRRMPSATSASQSDFIDQVKKYWGLIAKQRFPLKLGKWIQNNYMCG